jgi:uncharacterized tellurite resistance protein B-like protein
MNGSNNANPSVEALLSRMKSIASKRPPNSKDEISLATAIVLIGVASSDHVIDKFERTVILNGLKSLFRLSDETSMRRMNQAKSSLGSMQSSSSSAERLRDSLDMGTKRAIAQVIDNGIRCSNVVDHMEIYFARSFETSSGLGMSSCSKSSATFFRWLRRCAPLFSIPAMRTSLHCSLTMAMLRVSKALALLLVAFQPVHLAYGCGEGYLDDRIGEEGVLPHLTADHLLSPESIISFLMPLIEGTPGLLLMIASFIAFLVFAFLILKGCSQIGSNLKISIYTLISLALLILTILLFLLRNLVSTPC